MRQAGNIIRFIILIACSAPSGTLPAAGERLTGFSSEDSITIRSVEAWEDEEPDIIHFSGGFELRASDWFLTADSATLYGKLDDPETAILTGSPAVILVNTISQGRIETVSGEADRIMYHRESNSLSMEGSASLTRDEITMRGGKIEYDIGEDRISAGGDEGIQIKIRQED